MKAKLGIAPIAWWNDDLAGTERRRLARGMSASSGRGRFHRHGDRSPLSDGCDSARSDPRKRHGMRVCGGWFSGLLLDGDIETEKDRIARSRWRCSRRSTRPASSMARRARTIQGDRSAPLATKPKLSEDEIKVYGRKMTTFAEWCAEQGMPIYPITTTWPPRSRPSRSSTC